MDYLDPNKELRHRIILMLGYVLVAVAIGIATVVLLYQAYGFSIGKNGDVIQNGLTFFSSHPNPAKIYVNNQLKPVQTNTRLVLPAGIYNIKLTRDGYRDWQRRIELDGGSVEHFDYPFMVPKQLTTTKVESYTAAPNIMSESPDHKWLIVQPAGNLSSFEVYDLKNPTKAATTVQLPEGVLTKATGAETLKALEWADDNDHLSLQHDYDGKTEFVMLDRTDATQSFNINTTLSVSPTKLTLNNKKFDRYYLYDATTQQLKKATNKQVEPDPILEHVITYKSYSDDTILYATSDKSPAGKVLVKLKVGKKTYDIRSFSAGSNYLVDLTGYSGTLYVAAGSTDGNKVYIYKDPVGQLNNTPKQAAYPIQVLHVPQPVFLSFSASAQFVMAQGGERIGVYDIENKNGYNYVLKGPLDAPQLNATWMDGNRLTYVSASKLNMIDYDSMNQQALVAAGSQYQPAFDPDYKYLFVITPNSATGQFDLNRTALRTANDL